MRLGQLGAMRATPRAVARPASIARGDLTAPRPGLHPAARYAPRPRGQPVLVALRYQGMVSERFLAMRRSLTDEARRQVEDTFVTEQYCSSSSERRTRAGARLRAGDGRWLRRAGVGAVGPSAPATPALPAQLRRPGTHAARANDEARIYWLDLKPRRRGVSSGRSRVRARVARALLRQAEVAMTAATLRLVTALASALSSGVLRSSRATTYPADIRPPAGTQYPCAAGAAAGCREPGADRVTSIAATRDPARDASQARGAAPPGRGQRHGGGASATTSAPPHSWSGCAATRRLRGWSRSGTTWSPRSSCSGVSSRKPWRCEKA